MDPKTVEENYYGNLEKLNRHYSIADQLIVFDTSEADHVILANFNNGNHLTSIPYKDLPHWFVQYLPVLTQKIKIRQDLKD